jgi:hypothetical protein
MTLRYTRLGLLSILFVMAVAAGCGKKEKKSMKGDEEVTMQDFVDFFDDMKLPFAFTDTLLKKKGNDSLRIDNKIIEKLWGDTLFKDLYRKEKPKVYALGKFRNGEAETYLLIRTKGSQDGVFIMAADEQLVPKASMVLLASKGPAAEPNLVGIDKRYTITTVDEYKKPDGSPATYSTVYAYNTAGLFMVILSDGLKKGEEMEIINPIDTLPAKHALSGDYGADKKNFVSIRDGETTDKMRFFLHMEKSKQCVAELKGEARWVKKDLAIFDSNTDGCKVEFRFSGRTVRIAELDGCGSRRPMECNFNASYSKRSSPSKKSTKK